MFTTRRIRITVFLGLALLVPQAFAQKTPPNTDPQNKPRKVKKEPAKAFKEWIADVDPIITEEERRAWSKLQTDDEREKFIGIFWHLRDWSPDTEENEYREDYYERVTYVNEHFSSGIPGVKTDRGRIYLRFGKPDDVESHPSGGNYERPSWEGNGSTSTYPFERWFYRNIPGRSGAEVEFVDPTGSGEFRIAHNPFEKYALLNVPGGVSSVNGPSQADLVSAANGFGNPFSPRAQDSAFEWMDTIRTFSTPPPVNFDRLIDNPTPLIEDTFLTTNVQISFFKQSDNRSMVAFTVQTENKDLVFRDSGGVQTAQLNISGRISTVAGQRVTFFEDSVTTSATVAELVDAKERKSAYQKALPLPPGRYRVDLLVRDVQSGSASLKHVGFEVPKYGAELTSSSLILASVLEQVSGIPESRQFVIGDKKVISNISGTFHRGAPVGVYMQIYNAGIDQTTLRPSVDVEYVLMKDGKEVGKQVEDWRGSNNSGERLTLARLIDSRGLAPGEYRVEVRVRDLVSTQTLVQSADFKIMK